MQEQQKKSTRRHQTGSKSANQSLGFRNAHGSAYRVRTDAQGPLSSREITGFVALAGLFALTCFLGLYTDYEFILNSVFTSLLVTFHEPFIRDEKPYD